MNFVNDNPMLLSIIFKDYQKQKRIRGTCFDDFASNCYKVARLQAGKTRSEKNAHSAGRAKLRRIPSVRCTTAQRSALYDSRNVGRVHTTFPFSILPICKLASFAHQPHRTSVLLRTFLDRMPVFHTQRNNFECHNCIYSTQASPASRTVTQWWFAFELTPLRTLVSSLFDFFTGGTPKSSPSSAQRHSLGRFTVG